MKNSQEQTDSKLNKKNCMITYNTNMYKNLSGASVEDLSWSHFFSSKKTFFKVSTQNFPHHFTQYHLLRKFCCLSGHPNPEIRCVICTGVTPFVLMLHLNCTVLNWSELCNFFTYIIKMVNFSQQVLKPLGSCMQVFTVVDITTQIWPRAKDRNQCNKSAKELEDRVC